jgi:hypothetical protein
VFYFTDSNCTVLYATGTGFLQSSSGSPCVTSENVNINNKVSIDAISKVTCSKQQVTHTVFTGSTCGSGGRMSRFVTTGQCTSLPYGTGLFPELYAIVLGFECPNPSWNSTQPLMPASLQSCIQCNQASFFAYWYSFVEQPFYSGSNVTGTCVYEYSSLPCLSYYTTQCSEYSPAPILRRQDSIKCFPSQALLSCRICANSRNLSSYWYSSTSIPFSPNINTSGSCAGSLEDVPCGNYYVPVHECTGWIFSEKNRGPVVVYKSYALCSLSDKASSNTGSDNGALNAGIIAGIVIGLIIGSALLGLAAFFGYKRCMTVRGGHDVRSLFDFYFFSFISCVEFFLVFVPICDEMIGCKWFCHLLMKNIDTCFQAVDMQIRIG